MTVAPERDAYGTRTAHQGERQGAHAVLRFVQAVAGEAPIAVTGEDGTFTIKGLPPGDYELTVLHESALMEPTPATQNVTVKENETAKLDFTYQQRSKK